MKNLLALAVLFLSMVTTCAQRNKKIKGSGNVVTIERTTSDYNGISVSGFYEVELEEGTQGKITMKGEDNILDNIETEVNSGTLHIKSIDNVNLIPSRNEGVFITIPIDEIDKIRLSGSGDFTGKKIIKTDNLDIQVSGARNIDLTMESDAVSVATSGSSNIRLKGNSKKIKVRSSGSSNVKAYDLEVDDAIFELSGSSNVEITVNESIRSRVSGSGNIRYHGNPQRVNSKISGSGKVSKE
ncbi:MAG: head GIN domain-containing protein [Pricia sp.]